jgi:Flp pilus assembly protein TadG
MKLSRRFSGSESGVAAVEMGLVAPILLFALILMLDVGVAVAERMDLDRNVRAGVQAAMANINDPDDVLEVVVASLNGAQGVSVTVNKTCACGSSSTACTSWCSAQEPREPPSVFVNISAVKPYSGLWLPEIELKSRTHVQLR